MQSKKGFFCFHFRTVGLETCFRLRWARSSTNVKFTNKWAKCKAKAKVFAFISERKDSKLAFGIGKKYPALGPLGRFQSEAGKEMTRNFGSEIKIGNYIEFDPKLMIRFASLQKQKKTSKTGKTFRVYTDKNQMFSYVFWVLFCFSKPA